MPNIYIHIHMCPCHLYRPIIYINVQLYSYGIGIITHDCPYRPHTLNKNYVDFHEMHKTCRISVKGNSNYIS